MYSPFGDRRVKPHQDLLADLIQSGCLAPHFRTIEQFRNNPIFGVTYDRPAAYAYQVLPESATHSSDGWTTGAAAANRAEPGADSPLSMTDMRRTFRPRYLSFAGTYQCNLTCPHCCVPIEWPDRLDIPTALRFLERPTRYGIRTLGFTGGEPFLYPEFLLRPDPPGRRAGLSLRQDHDQRRLARRRGPPEDGAGRPAGRRLHRQARPERGQVPRHSAHRAAGRVLPHRPPGVRPRQHRVAVLRQPARPTRGWSRSATWRPSWTASSTGRRCCTAICWCRRS